MAIQQIEDLQRKLDRDLAWRKKEISGLRMSALRSDADRHYLFRAGLVLLCAHWEGFLKKGVALYLDHVFAQGLRAKELAPLMVAVALFNEVCHAAEAKYPGSEDHHLVLARLFQEGPDRVWDRPGWKIEVQGNPGSGLLERVLASAGIDERLGMDAATWTTTQVFIDEQLLRDRHLVAHGESFRLTRDEFLARAERLSLLLESLHSALMTTAVSTSYRAVA